MRIKITNQTVFWGIILVAVLVPFLMFPFQNETLFGPMSEGDTGEVSGAQMARRAIALLGSAGALIFFLFWMYFMFSDEIRFTWYMDIPPKKKPFSKQDIKQKP